jgi:hypothetical protein
MKAPFQALTFWPLMMQIPIIKTRNYRKNKPSNRTGLAQL